MSIIYNAYTTVLPFLWTLFTQLYSFVYWDNKHSSQLSAMLMRTVNKCLQPFVMLMSSVQVCFTHYYLQKFTEQTNSSEFIQVYSLFTNDYLVYSIAHKMFIMLTVNIVHANIANNILHKCAQVLFTICLPYFQYCSVKG